MIVVDASVVVDLLLGAASPAGDALADEFHRRNVVCAPHLVDAEVGQVLRRYAAAGAVSGRSAAAMVDDLAGLPIRRYPHTAILSRAFELRQNVTVYDALYLALAEGLGSRFLTGDAALAVVPGCRAAVDVVETTG